MGEAVREAKGTNLTRRTLLIVAIGLGAGSCRHADEPERYWPDSSRDHHNSTLSRSDELLVSKRFRDLAPGSIPPTASYADALERIAEDFGKDAEVIGSRVDDDGNLLVAVWVRHEGFYCVLDDTGAGWSLVRVYSGWLE